PSASGRSIRRCPRPKNPRRTASPRRRPPRRPPAPGARRRRAARRAPLRAPRRPAPRSERRAVADLVVSPAVVIPDAELAWTAARSSGPGGQNVNKVASKVELRFDFAASGALSAPVKARLRALATSRLDAEGRILVTSQLTRDQSRNLEDARQKLAELIRAALVVP